LVFMLVSGVDLLEHSFCQVHSKRMIDKIERAKVVNTEDTQYRRIRKHRGYYYS